MVINMNTQRKVAIVTGANGGIGRVICQSLASAHYLIAGLDREGIDLERNMSQLGTEHRAYVCDLADDQQIQRVVKEIAAHYGHIDLIVNNAAIGPTMSATIDTSLDEFKQAMSVNWMGPLQLIRQALPWMPIHGAAIVNIASLAGVVSNPKRNAYSASKAAMISLTRSLACELAHKQIRVNAIAPGYVRTNMVAELETSGKVDLHLVRQRIPMGRLARPEEIAHVVTFLGSEQARYITGSIVPVDGGWACFNQAGNAHPAQQDIPQSELNVDSPLGRSRVVVITGAAQGIGRAIAEKFAAQGDRLILLDLNQEPLEKLRETLAGEHLSFCVDISDEQQVKQVFHSIQKLYSEIDVLVNNAGIAEQFLPLEQQSVEAIEKLFDINLNGAFCCIRECLNAMQHKAGVVINMGSINSHLAFSPRHAYGASKAAIEMLSRCLTAELAPQGIRVLTLCPGYIQTPGVVQLEQSGRINVENIRRRIPLGRLGQPEDIAEAAYFLASPQASYINGAAVYVDGGWTAFGNAGDASSPSAIYN